MAQTNCVEMRSNLSNTVTTVINHAQISNADGGLVKYVDHTSTDIGEVLNYTIVVKNTGNTSANNVIFQDTIPQGTTLVPNSVKVNGVTQAGSNPQTGIGLGIVGPGATTTVTFQVLVGTNPNPTPNPIPNNSNVSYQYTSDPSFPNGEKVTNQSNTVNTKVNHAQISPSDGGFSKTVSENYADVGDTVTYTIFVKNTGSVTANNVVLTDTLPNDTTFVPNSVTVNGSSKPGANPETGVTVGSVAAGASYTITFKVVVNTVPNPNPLVNDANISYNYIVSPSLPPVQVGNTTGQVETQVNTAHIPTPIKTVTPTYADLGDTVTYTLTLENTGNVDATNVTVTDTVPNGMVFINNSVTVDSITIPGANPQTGINVGTLSPGQYATVTFQASVTSIPNPNPSVNIAVVDYHYTVNPSVPNGGHKEVPSTPATNTVNHGQLSTINNGIHKTATPDFASVGDTVTYTLRISNTGNVSVNNVFLTDTIPNGSKFVPGSITVNGTTQTTANINNGLQLGNIGANQAITVTYEVVVYTLPNPNPMNNSFNVNYSYTVDPSNPNAVKAFNVSNTVQTPVNDAIIGKGANSFTKTPDKAFADVGDTITYTVVLTNTGNVPGNNVVLQDTIPNGTTFINNSVTINSTTIPGSNPETGIGIGTLNPGETVTVTFAVEVNTIPNPNPIPNKAGLQYTYTKDPTKPDGEVVNGGSNTSYTQVNHGDVPVGGVIKSSDTNYAKRGDTITYTFVVPNTGNVTVNNVVLYDSIPAESVFVPNSATVNGTVVTGSTPQGGIPVGTIAPNNVATVTYQVVVTTVPANGVLTNMGTIDYNYIVDPSLPPVKGSTDSNENDVTINDAKISNVDGGYVKSVTPAYAQLGDTLTYTLHIENTGNVDAMNVVVTDSIPPGTTYVQNSLLINGSTIANSNPGQGVNIGTVPPQTPVTITFKVIVTSIPANGIVDNKANINYEFKVDPNKPPVTASGSTNQVETVISSVNFGGANFKKTSTPENVAIGDTITYTFNVTNTGNVNAENTMITDPIPPGTALVPNSVVLNGATLPNADPSIGINLQTLDVGETDTLTFQVVVTSIPAVNPIPDTGLLTYTSRINPNNPPVPGQSNSNTVYNKVNSADMIVNKTSSPQAAVVGETVTYTLTVSNQGNIDAQNVIIEDMLPPELEFVQGSVTVNGKADPTKNIVNGIALGTVKAGQTVTITFQAVVLDRPESGVIDNQASSNYEFIVDPSLPPRQGTTDSNKNEITVGIAELNVTKTADKQEVVLGDTITYTVQITNTGTLTANNITVKDILQDGTSFVPNSFTLNGVSINGLVIQDGFNIGSLAPGQTDTIQYQVKVDRVCGCCVIVNSVFVRFNYNASAQSVKQTQMIGPVSTTVTAVSPAFKQFNLDSILVIPCPKPDVEEVSYVSASAVIEEYHIIETIKGHSAENFNLTGNKLVINGLLKADLEYISEQCKSMNMATFERKFSTYIVLPEDIDTTANMEVSAIIEDVYFKRLNCREVFTNVTLMVKAQISC